MRPSPSLRRSTSKRRSFGTANTSQIRLKFSESIATFGLLLTIFGCVARSSSATPYAIGLYIVAAYWFTASTSFANPAIAFGRMFSDTFAGIAPASVPGFVVAELAGAGLAVLIVTMLERQP